MPVSTHEHHPAVVEEVNYCAVHPDRETSLRCNRCGRYMCVQCAVSTPVGYRCRQCVRGIEDKFFTSNPADYVIIFVVSTVLSAIAGYLIAAIVRWLLFVILLAAPAGGAIAEAAMRLTGRRRGRYSALIAAAGVLLGGLAPLLYILLVSGRFIPNLSLLLYAGIATAAVYGRFRMRI